MRIGSLFSGYGGLDMAVEAVTGATTAWFVEFDKAPSKILAHHWPETPNHGDVTEAKWTPDCPVCGDRLALYRVGVDAHKAYWCQTHGEFDLSIRFDDPEADFIPEPVDIITGGSPCQDLSHAGKRGGMTEGTRSNLWVAMREAIAALRPSLVIWENVRGAYSAAADSEMEPCAGCVGDSADRGPALRALGRVLGDLSDLGYDAGWHGLRAADVGAPHGRFRVFVVAHAADNRRQLRVRGGQSATLARATGNLLPTPAAYDGERGGPQHPDKRQAGGHSVTLQDAVHGLLPTPRVTDGTKGGPNQRGTSGDLMLPSAVTLLPTPTTQDGANNGGPSQYERNSLPLNAVAALLPTPAVNDMGEGKTPEAWDEWTAKMQAAHGNGNGNGKSLAIEAQRLLPTVKATNNENRQNEDRYGPNLGMALGTTPGYEHRLLQTPSVADGGGGHLTRSGARSGEQLLPGQAKAMHGQDWGIYADAIARWEVLTRPAPAPTQQSRKGTPQLSPLFSEWLMGLPAGHVTDVPGLSRNDQLKALGNGVVPQQAAAALRFLLAHIESEAA